MPQGLIQGGRLQLAIAVMVMILLPLAASCSASPSPAVSTANAKYQENDGIPAPSQAELDQMAKLNYLRTEGAKIVDSQGQEVKITGLSWFGLETDVAAPHGLWARNYEEILSHAVKLGFNPIRLPYANETLNPDMTPKAIDFYANPDLKGLNGLQIMDKIVAAAGERGFKIN